MGSVETRQLSSEEHTESELDLGEALSPGPEPESDRRLPLGVSSRGLRGAAAVLGFVTVVVCAVVGGSMAVDSVARFDDGRNDGASALLKNQQLDAQLPDPVTDTDDTTTIDSDKASPTPKASPSSPAATKKAAASGEKVGSGGNSGNGASTERKQVNQVADRKPATPRIRQAAPLAEMGVIKNLSTGFCVDLMGADVPEAGAAVSQYDCIPGVGDNQDFQLVEQYGQYLIRNLKTNYCLDLPGTGAVGESTGVLASPCQAGESDNQMFRARPQGGGYYLVNVKSGLCLDVSNTNGGNKNAGQALTLFPCTPDDDHIWTVS
ncbi:hypothetical protein GCM10022223_41550 [Kineosporia mesophila]|uniref:Ricin B lectin domain-containing protein n=1 Tax=Kineosporia mesophila TaxID=566012 RepID=A0ABP7A0K3_9ACTN